MDDVSLKFQKLVYDKKIKQIEDEENKKKQEQEQEEVIEEEIIEPGSVGINDREGSLFALETKASLESLAHKVGTSAATPLGASTGTSSTATDDKTYQLSGITFTVKSNKNTGSCIYNVDKNHITFTGANCEIIIDEVTNNAIEIELFGSNIILTSNAKVASITNNASNSIINGTDDDDIIINKGMNSTINAGKGNDIITSSGSKATINGGEGNDTITSTGAYSKVNGQAGRDYVNAKGVGIKVDLGSQEDTAYVSGKNIDVDATKDENLVIGEGKNINVKKDESNSDVYLSGSDNKIDEDVVSQNKEYRQPQSADDKMRINGELLTGIGLDNKMYENGELLTGVSKTDGKLYEKGILNPKDNVEIDGKLYSHGVLAKGIIVLDNGHKYINGILRNTFGPDGYDEEGYDREGYNRDGFNRDGYDREGYKLNKDGSKTKTYTDTDNVYKSKTIYQDKTSLVVSYSDDKRTIIKKESFNKKDVKIWEETYNNKQLTSKTEYRTDGTKKSYTEIKQDGSKCVSSYSSDGEKITSRSYYVNNVMRKEETFKSGSITSITTYSSDGQFELKTKYSNGVATSYGSNGQPYTGTINEIKYNKGKVDVDALFNTLKNKGFINANGEIIKSEQDIDEFLKSKNLIDEDGEVLDKSTVENLKSKIKAPAHPDGFDEEGKLWQNGKLHTGLYTGNDNVERLYKEGDIIKENTSFGGKTYIGGTGILAEGKIDNKFYEHGILIREKVENTSEQTVTIKYYDKSTKKLTASTEFKNAKLQKVITYNNGNTGTTNTFNWTSNTITSFNENDKTTTITYFDINQNTILFKDSSRDFYYTYKLPELTTTDIPKNVNSGKTNANGIFNEKSYIDGVCQDTKPSDDEIIQQNKKTLLDKWPFGKTNENNINWTITGTKIDSLEINNVEYDVLYNADGSLFAVISNSQTKDVYQLIDNQNFIEDLYDNFKDSLSSHINVYFKNETTPVLYSKTNDGLVNIDIETIPMIESPEVPAYNEIPAKPQVPEATEQKIKANNEQARACKDMLAIMGYDEDTIEIYNVKSENGKIVAFDYVNSDDDFTDELREANKTHPSATAYIEKEGRIFGIAYNGDNISSINITSDKYVTNEPQSNYDVESIRTLYFDNNKNVIKSIDYSSIDSNGYKCNSVSVSEIIHNNNLVEQLDYKYTVYENVPEVLVGFLPTTPTLTLKVKSVTELNNQNRPVTTTQYNFATEQDSYSTASKTTYVYRNNNSNQYLKTTYISTQYDNDKNISGKTNRIEDFEYNSDGYVEKITTETKSLNSNTPTENRTISNYTYNNVGLLQNKKETNSSDNTTSGTSWEYDAKGKITKKTDEKMNIVTQHVYDESGVGIRTHRSTSDEITVTYYNSDRDTIVNYDKPEKIQYIYCGDITTTFNWDNDKISFFTSDGTLYDVDYHDTNEGFILYHKTEDGNEVYYKYTLPTIPQLNDTRAENPNIPAISDERANGTINGIEYEYGEIKQTEPQVTYPTKDPDGYWKVNGENCDGEIDLNDGSIGTFDNGILLKKVSTDNNNTTITRYENTIEEKTSSVVIFNSDELVTSIEIYDKGELSCTQNGFKYAENNVLVEYTEIEGQTTKTYKILDRNLNSENNKILLSETIGEEVTLYSATSISDLPTKASDTVAKITITAKTQYTGLYKGEDNVEKLYKDGVVNTALTVYPEQNGKLYEDGVLSVGTKEFEKSLYINGEKDTRDFTAYNGKLYAQGDLAENIPEKAVGTELFLNGIKATDYNHEFDEKIYQQGNLDTANETEHNNHLYKKGVKVTDDFAVSNTNKLYENGTLSTREFYEHTNGIIYYQGLPASDTYTREDGSIETYESGVLIRKATTNSDNTTKIENYTNKKLTAERVYDDNDKLTSIKIYEYEGDEVTKTIEQFNITYSDDGSEISGYNEKITEGSTETNTTVSIQKSYKDDDNNDKVLYKKTVNNLDTYYIASKYTIPSKDSDDVTKIFSDESLANVTIDNCTYSDGLLTKVINEGKTTVNTYDDNKKLISTRVHEDGKVISITVYEDERTIEQTDITYNPQGEVTSYSEKITLKNPPADTDNPVTYNYTVEQYYIDNENNEKILISIGDDEKVYYVAPKPTFPAIDGPSADIIGKNKEVANETINGVLYQQGHLVPSQYNAEQTALLNEIIALNSDFELSVYDIGDATFGNNNVTFKAKGNTWNYTKNSTKQTLTINDRYNVQLYYGEFNLQGTKINDITTNADYVSYMDFLNSLDAELLENYIDLSILQRITSADSASVGDFIDFDLSDDIKSDIDILKEAQIAVQNDTTGNLTFGSAVSNLYVKDYIDAEIASSNTHAGDVFTIGNSLYVNDGENLIELSFTKDKYLELFPPVGRYAVKQGAYGDCYFIAGVLLGCFDNQISYAQTLQLFDYDKQTDDITITFKGLSGYPVTFPDGELFEMDYTCYKTGREYANHKNGFFDGTLGMQLLEQAYALAKFASESTTPVSVEDLDIDRAVDFIGHAGLNDEAQNDIFGENVADLKILVDYASMDKITLDNKACYISDYFDAQEAIYQVEDELGLKEYRDTDILYDIRVLSYYYYAGVNNKKNLWSECLEDGVASIEKIGSLFNVIYQNPNYSNITKHIKNILSYLNEHQEDFQTIASALKDTPEYMALAYSENNAISNFDARVREAILMVLDKEEFINDIEENGLYNALVSDQNKRIDSLADQYETGNIILGMGSYSSEDNGTLFDDNAKNKFISGGHAYTIRSIDKENRTLTISNPWRGALTTTITYADLTKYYCEIFIADVTKIEKAEPKPIVQTVPTKDTDDLWKINGTLCNGAIENEDGSTTTFKEGVRLRNTKTDTSNNDTVITYYDENDAGSTRATFNNANQVTKIETSSNGGESYTTVNEFTWEDNIPKGIKNGNDFYDYENYNPTTKTVMFATGGGETEVHWTYVIPEKPATDNLTATSPNVVDTGKTRADGAITFSDNSISTFANGTLLRNTKESNNSTVQTFYENGKKVVETTYDTNNHITKLITYKNLGREVDTSCEFTWEDNKITSFNQGNATTVVFHEIGNEKNRILFAVGEGEDARYYTYDIPQKADTTTKTQTIPQKITTDTNHLANGIINGVTYEAGVVKTAPPAPASDVPTQNATTGLWEINGTPCNGAIENEDGSTTTFKEGVKLRDTITDTAKNTVITYYNNDVKTTSTVFNEKGKLLRTEVFSNTVASTANEFVWENGKITQFIMGDTTYNVIAHDSSSNTIVYAVGEGENVKYYTYKLPENLNVNRTTQNNVEPLKEDNRVPANTTINGVKYNNGSIEEIPPEPITTTDTLSADGLWRINGELCQGAYEQADGSFNTYDKGILLRNTKTIDNYTQITYFQNNKVWSVTIYDTEDKLIGIEYYGEIDGVSIKDSISWSDDKAVTSFQESGKNYPITWFDKETNTMYFIINENNEERMYNYTIPAKLDKDNLSKQLPNNILQDARLTSDEVNGNNYIQGVPRTQGVSALTAEDIAEIDNIISQLDDIAGIQFDKEWRGDSSGYFENYMNKAWSINSGLKEILESAKTSQNVVLNRFNTGNKISSITVDGVTVNISLSNIVDETYSGGSSSDDDGNTKDNNFYKLSSIYTSKLTGEVTKGKIDVSYTEDGTFSEITYNGTCADATYGGTFEAKFKMADNTHIQSADFHIENNAGRFNDLPVSSDIYYSVDANIDLTKIHATLVNSTASMTYTLNTSTGILTGTGINNGHRYVEMWIMNKSALLPKTVNSSSPTYKIGRIIRAEADEGIEDIKYNGETITSIQVIDFVGEGWEEAAATNIVTYPATMGGYSYSILPSNYLWSVAADSFLRSNIPITDPFNQSVLDKYSNSNLSKADTDSDIDYEIYQNTDGTSGTYFPAHYDEQGNYIPAQKVEVGGKEGYKYELTKTQNEDGSWTGYMTQERQNDDGSILKTISNIQYDENEQIKSKTETTTKEYSDEYGIYGEVEAERTYNYTNGNISSETGELHFSSGVIHTNTSYDDTGKITSYTATCDYYTSTTEYKSSGATETITYTQASDRKNQVEVINYDNSGNISSKTVTNNTPTTEHPQGIQYDIVNNNGTWEQISKDIYTGEVFETKAIDFLKLNFYGPEL